jgi:hypothetical protein
MRHPSADARVRRVDALPVAKDRLTVIAISTCLFLALISFGMLAISTV